MFYMFRESSLAMSVKSTQGGGGRVCKRIGKRAHEKTGDGEQSICLLTFYSLLFLFVGYVSFAGDLTFQKHLRAGWIGCLP